MPRTALVILVEKVEDIFEIEGFISLPQVLCFGMCALPDLKALRCISKLTTWFNFRESYYIWKYLFLLH